MPGRNSVYGERAGQAGRAGHKPAGLKSLSTADHVVFGPLAVVRGVSFEAPPTYGASMTTDHDREDCQSIQARLDASEVRARERLAELEAIYGTAPVGLCVIGPDFRFLRMNETLAKTNGRSAEEHIGRTLREVVPDLADQAESMLRRVFETGEPIENVEIEGETPAQPGVKRVWKENWIPLRDAKTGKVFAVNIVAVEITEEKRNQKRLEESEARARYLAGQRELLLHELNHRMKNSLALVSSILALQRRYSSGDSECALEDAQRRIMTIAAVHESLYNGDLHRGIDLIPFVEKLLARAGALRPDIVTHFEPIGPVDLPSNKAVSFGLLLNELLVNALRHAFPEGGTGEVHISLAPRDRHSLILTIKDNGAGLPDNWSLEGSGGLGTRLIKGLADQIDADIAIQSTPGGGTRFDVVMPLRSATRGSRAERSEG